MIVVTVVKVIQYLVTQSWFCHYLSGYLVVGGHNCSLLTDFVNWPTVNIYFLIWHFLFLFYIMVSSSHTLVIKSVDFHLCICDSSHEVCFLLIPIWVFDGTGKVIRPKFATLLQKQSHTLHLTGSTSEHLNMGSAWHIKSLSFCSYESVFAKFLFVFFPGS